MIQYDTLKTILIIGAFLFIAGLIGFTIKRNLIIIFLCTELMFQGIILSLVGFSAYHSDLNGHSFIVFILTVAAAEAAIALTLSTLLFKKKHNLDILSWTSLAENEEEEQDK